MGNPMLRQPVNHRDAHGPFEQTQPADGNGTVPPQQISREPRLSRFSSVSLFRSARFIGGGGERQKYESHRQRGISKQSAQDYFHGLNEDFVAYKTRFTAASQPS